MNDIETKRPLILISNDDGVNAPGIYHLADCVREFGDVYVVAPDGPQSGQASAITVGRGLRVTEHPDYNGVKVFSVNGSPVDCVKIAMHAIVPRKPDFVFTGVNHGPNAGNSIIYSGTMGAAFEGCMLGIPSVGFSLITHDLGADFTPTTAYIKQIAAKVIADGLPYGVCLNVNFPVCNEIKGLKVVKAAMGHWIEEYLDYTDPNGKPFYMLTGRYQADNPDDPETDLYWLDRGYGTIVPARTDQTAHDLIPSFASLF